MDAKTPAVFSTRSSLGLAGLAGLLVLASAAPAIAGPGSAPPQWKASATTGPDGSPLTPADQKELEQMQQAVGRFETASKEFRGVVSAIVKQEYEKKRRELVARYDGNIKAAEAEEKLRRADAIAVLERFLAKYPTDRRWTPDVIFRLAELYFERSNDEYLASVDAAQKAAEQAAAANSKETTATSPPPPTPDYEKTIALYRRLITEFPDYRLIDGAYYLLGYCLGEMNKEPEARQAFLALVCSNHYQALDPPAPPVPTKARAQTQFQDPYAGCTAIKEDSRFVPEAWTRIGEYHFDGNELELAIAAYARVLKYKDSPYYDKALYKLAWAYYRADKYPEAIKKFDELVVFSDASKANSGKEGSDLRQEAIQYLGISFSEKDWNGDSIDDAETGLQRIQAFYQGREKEPHVREVYLKLADIYFDETEFQKAVDVYERLVALWPLSPDIPKVYSKELLAYERMNDQLNIIKTIDRVGTTLGNGQPWRVENGQNKQAVDEADQLMEQSIIKFAVDHHRGAQALKNRAFAVKPADAKLLELASREYALAADNYAHYLQQFPNSKYVYDYTYAYGDTLYFSQRYADAAVQYEKVRDSNLDNRYQEDSALNAVKSYEYLLDAEVRGNKIKIPANPEVGKVTLPVTPQPIPDEVKHLQSAYDAFVQRIPNSGRVPTMTYKAAEIDFKYLDFEKARPRFIEIIEKYCKSTDDVATQAGNAILATYAIQNDLDKIIEWTGKIKSSTCTKSTVATAPGQKPDESGSAIDVLEKDARFQKAQQLYDAGKFDDAGPAFVAFVDGNPKNVGGNNDKALNNAAVAFEKAKRYSMATRMYERIVAEYPTSAFVDDALFRTAVNYQKYFEFDKAVVSYQKLARDPKFKSSSHHTDALFNAAVILENDQAYNDAATLFQEYSREPKVEPKEAADAFFRSGLVYLKNKDAKKTRDTFEKYITLYGAKDPKKKIEAQFHVAESKELAKDRAGALAEYKKVAEAGAQVAPASDAAEFPAHAAFILAENELPALEKLTMTGNLKTFKVELDRMKAEIARVVEEYNRVVAYRRATWALAAYFRIGYAYEHLSKSLGVIASAPCPKEIMKKVKQEGCDIYLQELSSQIEAMLSPVDEEVVKRYRVTLEQAGKFGVSNEWTKLARVRANAYKPDEFPMTKDERIEMQLEDPK